MDIDVTVVILMLNKACMKGINQLSIHKCLLRAGQYFVIGMVYLLPIIIDRMGEWGSFSLQSYTIHID